MNFALIYNKNISWCENHRYDILNGNAEKYKEFQYDLLKIIKWRKILWN